MRPPINTTLQYALGRELLLFDFSVTDVKCLATKL
jgi:hypothetical protein